jgi:type I restriction enzyme R subunit
MNKDAGGKRIPETETAARFKGEEPFPADAYQVLIVAEKYQTGFDEPLLHTMYVDKKLDGVKAVQTLSRLNRTTPGKDGTFVLDFANDADDIKAAFAPFFETTWTEATDPNILYTLQHRIETAGVIDEREMTTFVQALLKDELQGNKVLYATTDAAVERYLAITEMDDREDFRTALRDFTRMYAFLGQVVPYTDTDLEGLFYYGSALLKRLPKLDDDDGGDVDISDAAVLTHLRTQISGEHDLSFDEGDGDEGLPGFEGGGKGGQTSPEKVRLSQIIDALNAKFGTDFSEDDAVLAEAVIHSAMKDDGIVATALHNTEENFGLKLSKDMDDLVLDHQEATHEFHKRYFDDPDFNKAFSAFVQSELYRRIREGSGDAA